MKFIYCNANADVCNAMPGTQTVEADMLEKAGPKEFTVSGLVPPEWVVSEKQTDELRYLVNCDFADNESESCGLEVVNIARGGDDVSKSATSAVRRLTEGDPKYRRRTLQLDRRRVTVGLLRRRNAIG